MENTLALKYKILTATVVVAVAVVGVFLYLQYNQTKKASMILELNEKYATAKALQASGDYTGAINAFTPLVKYATDKATEGRLKMTIATNLSLRNQGDDKTDSIQLYKEVYNDQSMPAKERAAALTSLAGVMNGGNESFYKTYFNDPPFKDFPYATAYLKILQLADEINPNSYTEYLIAGNYYAPLLNNNISIGTTTPEQVAKTIQEYIKKADSLAISDQSSYRPAIMLKSYYLRATAMNASSKVLKNISLEDRENAFKLIMVKGAPYEQGNNYDAMVMVLKGRFSYASFMMKNFSKSRYPDILNILKPFGLIATSTESSSIFIRSQFSLFFSPTRIGADRRKLNADNLAKISQEFKDFFANLELKL